jgi:hypothetical protein
MSLLSTWGYPISGDGFWQQNPETASPAQLGFGGNASPMGFNDFLTIGQPQAVTVLLSIGIKGGKDMMEFIRGDAMPCIGDFDSVKFRLFPGTDTECAASVPHGVACVKYQVHQNLAERTGVGGNSELSVNIQDQIDLVFGEIPSNAAKNIIQQR